MVDVRRGWGIEDALVVLQQGNGEVERTWTRGRGAFSFAADPEAKSARIWVRPPYGKWWITTECGTPAELTDAQRSGREALEFLVADRPSGPVSGRVFRAGTREPLAHFRFWIESRIGANSWRQELETDELGRFRTPEDVQGGLIEIGSAYGNGRPSLGALTDLSHDPATEPWELEFSTGRVLKVQLAGAVPPDATSLQLWGYSREGNRPFLRTSLRSTDSELWVRLPQPAFPVESQAPVHFTVRDTDGLIEGARQVRWGEAGQALLAFDLKRTAALAVQTSLEWPPLDIPDHRRVFGGWSYRMQAELVSADGELLELRSGWKPRSFRWLDPGEYLLRARTRNHSQEERPIVLTAGEITTVSMDMKLVEDTRTVRGIIRTRSGEPLADQVVSLTLKGRPDAVWSASWDRDRTCGTGVDFAVRLDAESEREVGRFLFEHVPRVPFEIQARSGEVWSKTEVPSEISVVESPTGDLDVEIVQVDPEHPSGYGFRVLRRDTNTFTYWVETRPGDAGPPLLDCARNGQVIALGNPSERRFEWAIRSPGCVPAFGTEASFEPEPDGEKFFATVELEPGWGARVVVVGPERKPIAGAQVLCDGIPAGVTDDEGRAFVRAEVVPSELRVTYFDWDGPRFWPRPSHREPWHKIVLEPPE